MELLIHGKLIIFVFDLKFLDWVDLRLRDKSYHFKHLNYNLF